MERDRRPKRNEKKIQEKIEDEDDDIQEEVSEKYLLYKILGLDKDADAAMIRKRFKLLTIEFHPDKNPSPEAKEKFQQINEAYQILIDPQTKRVYDQTGDFASTNIKDIRAFVDAYLYYREKFKQIEVKDIEDFAKSYKGGKEEEEDLMDYYDE